MIHRMVYQSKVPGHPIKPSSHIIFAVAAWQSYCVKPTMAHHNRRTHNNSLVDNGTAIVNRLPSTGVVDAKPAQRTSSISHSESARRTISSCSKSKVAAKRHRHQTSLSDSRINTSAKALLPLLSSLSSLVVQKTSLKKSPPSLVRQTLSSATANLLYNRVRNHERATYSYLLKRKRKRTHRRVSLKKMSSLDHLGPVAADEPLPDQETVNHPTPSSASSSRSTSPSDSSSSRQQSESVTSVSSAESSQKAADAKVEEVKERVESKVEEKVKDVNVSTQATGTDAATASDTKIGSAKRKHEETEDDTTPQPKKVVKTIRLIIKKPTPARSTSPPRVMTGAATDEPPLMSGARASPPPLMTSAVAKPSTKIILKRPSSDVAPPVMTPALANGLDHKGTAKQKKQDKGKRKLIEEDDEEKTDPAPKRARYTKNTYEGSEKAVHKMEYYERRRHEMLVDPLGYDDLVRTTNKPIPAHAQRKFLRWERHYRHPKPEKFEMSGALNPPDMTSALAGSGNKDGAENLSKSARKRAHKKRVEEEVAALRREKSRERTTSGGETEGEEKLTGKGKGVARVRKAKATSIGYQKQQQQRKMSAGRKYNGGSD
ncbi:hypothetical protein B0T21DRAFT_355571 [Apiosordaria backusii]|uniref:Uncharacterized protein n=1 Tax=Apiosordaria backusii TaxID=314023 RepID=A0AA40EZ37_9PEZI|nr:hypothetical protein B0T21DRAFT_355571 [Apiosordaria backusii]